MKKASRHNPIGTLPMDKGVCALLQDKQGNMICEAYMYRVGFSDLTGIHPLKSCL